MHSEQRSGDNTAGVECQVDTICDIGSFKCHQQIESLSFNIFQSLFVRSHRKDRAIAK